jgi:hypothetical protein
MKVRAERKIPISIGGHLTVVQRIVNHYNVRAIVTIADLMYTL